MSPCEDALGDLGSTWCLSVSTPLSLSLSLSFTLCNLVTTEALDHNILASLVKNKQKHRDEEQLFHLPFFSIHPPPLCILLLERVIMMTGWLVPLQDYFEQLAWTLRALGGAKKSFFFFPGVLRIHGVAKSQTGLRLN